MVARILYLMAVTGLLSASAATAQIDPNLVGWWNFEEEGGTLAVDSSGHGHHGTLMGDPQWVSGHDGLALDLDGQGDYIETGKLPSELGVGGDAPRTVALWVYPRSFNGGGLYDMGGDGIRQSFSLRTQEVQGRWQAQYGEIDWNFGAAGVDEWVHLVHVCEPGRVRVYVNASDRGALGHALRTSDDRPLRIGTCAGVAFDGLIDDVRIYNRAATRDEVRRIMSGSPLMAWYPQPQDGALTDIARGAVLSWDAGAVAIEHDVYFGTDEAEVRDAAVETEAIHRGRWPADPTSYVVPEQPLQWNTTYYWRVDEIAVNGTLTVGKVWSFETADYLIIDDFESYTDYRGSLIYETWIDGWDNGTGSIVGYLETICWGIPAEWIHSGMQSMPFTYDNTVFPWYSEAFRIWEEPQDWTRFGVDTLTLYLTGLNDWANDPDQLYVALADEAGHLKVVNHPDPLAVQTVVWKRWDIPLGQFTAAGVDVTHIKQMFIGVGDRDNPTPAGEGLIHLDDIRLTRSDMAAEPNTVPEADPAANPDFP